jgi:hypothetical protein
MDVVKVRVEESIKACLFEADSRDPLQILRRVETSYSAVVEDESF